MGPDRAGIPGGEPGPPPLPPPPLRRLRRLGWAARGLAGTAAFGLVALAAALGALLAVEAGPSISRFGPAFLTGSQWVPGRDLYGAVPAVTGTLLTSGLALVFAVPVALGVALLSTEFAPARWRGPLAYFVDLGAAIPSVVYGFWALEVLKPVMQSTVEPALGRWTGGRYLFSGPPLGLGILTAGVILGIMIVPTVAAFSREALRAVPRPQREAALSLGSTRWEAARLAVLGPAAPGIVGAIALGLGRALGETIAVALVIGASPGVPSSLFSQGSTIPTTLVAGLSGSFGLELSALYELALVLFVLSFAINLGARELLRRIEAAPPSALPAGGRRILRPPPARFAPGGVGSAPSWWGSVRSAQPRRRTRRRAVEVVVVVLLVAALAVAAYPLVSLLRTAVENGGPAVVRPSFYTSGPPPACGVGQQPCPLGGIGPAIEGTFVLLGLGSLIGLPLGLLTGIYLSEYARRRVGRSVGAAVDALIGTPSILIGAFVLALFLRVDPLDARTALSGGLALGFLMAPIVAKATETALRTVPASVRDAALALGFPRHRVTGRVVLGSCRGALVTGILFAVMRAGGEAAAVLVTAGSSQFWLTSLRGPVAALAPFIFEALTVNASPNYTTDAWGAALVLLGIMAAIGLAARLVLRAEGRRSPG
jgi:phosphate transport system permease protein